MRYREILDYESESHEDRLERLRQMYGSEPMEDRAKAAEVDLVAARAEKLRAEALAAAAKAETEYAEGAEIAEREVALLVSRAVASQHEGKHPDD